VDSLTIGGLLESATRYLRRNRSTSPHLDAELLLAQILGMERAQLRGDSECEVGPCAADAYSGLIARRGGHEPVAYILGRAYFRRLCLKVTPAVLIPRPETEELVETALEVLRRKPPWGGLAAPAVSAAGEASALTAVRGPMAPPLLADVGTGSGAIALSLAQETGLRVLATDSSAAALKVAAANAAATGLQRLVEFRKADLLSGVADGSLHLIISNPPYVRSEELSALSPDIRLFEPASALDGGPDGLTVYRRLLPEAARTLRPGGTLLVEVGYDQAQAVESLALEAGFALVRVRQDLSRKDRIVEAVLPGAFALGAEDLDASTIETMHRALGGGAIFGVPTDTVYGIAARWDSAAGIEALFAAKGRTPAQPVAVLFASVDAVRRALPDLSDRSLAVLEALLPGPYTFIVATAVPRSRMVGTVNSLGIRVPAHPELLRLLDGLGLPLAATSANLSGEAAAPALREVDPLVLAHCSAALSLGAQAGKGPADLRSPASTVVDLRPWDAGGMPVVVREGAVPASEVVERIKHLR
jgi:release factor glutamine methyltransferase